MLDVTATECSLTRLQPELIISPTPQISVHSTAVMHQVQQNLTNSHMNSPFHAHSALRDIAVFHLPACVCCDHGCMQDRALSLEISTNHAGNARSKCRHDTCGSRYQYHLTTVGNNYC